MTPSPEPEPGRERSAELDAAFEEITSGWREDRPSWPDDEPAAVGEPRREPADQDDAADPAADPGADPGDDRTDDDHFVPPEPPPLPRPRLATVAAMALFLLGIVLVWAPSVIGVSSQYGLPVGLLSMAGAIAWLVARLRPGPPPDSGWDDGARV